MTHEKLNEVLDILRAGKRLIEAEKHGYELVNTSAGVYEFVKKTEPEETGTFLNPILWVGQAVEIGKWYFTVDKDLPHEAVAQGIPNDFYDRQFFDYVEAPV